MQLANQPRVRWQFSSTLAFCQIWPGLWQLAVASTLCLLSRLPPSPPTSGDRRLPRTQYGSTWRPVQRDFSFSVSSGCCSCKAIWLLAYTRKYLEAAVAVIWHNIKKTESSWNEINWLLLSKKLTKVQGLCAQWAKTNQWEVNSSKIFYFICWGNTNRTSEQ